MYHINGGAYSLIRILFQYVILVSIKNVFKISAQLQIASWYLILLNSDFFHIEFRRWSNEQFS